MSKITNDGLTRSGTGCFIAAPIATMGVKGLTVNCVNRNKVAAFQDPSLGRKRTKDFEYHVM